MLFLYKFEDMRDFQIFISVPLRHFNENFQFFSNFFQDHMEVNKGIYHN